MTHPGGRPLKFDSVEALQDKIDDYFETEAWSGEGDKKFFAPTVSGLAYHLDVTTETLRNYESRDEFFATIKKAKQRIENALERRLYGRDVTGTIFNLKNNFGWKDKSEHAITGKDGGPVEFRKSEDMTDDELAAIAAGGGAGITDTPPGS